MLKYLCLMSAMLTAVSIVMAEVSGNIGLDSVDFTTSPKEIVKGLTTELQLQCHFKLASVQSMASVLSILISYSSNTNQPSFEYIASVNEIEGHAHNITGGILGISGLIDNGGVSHLCLTLDSAHSGKEGMYRCEVNGFDQVGKPLTLTSTTTVNASQPDLWLLFDQLSIIDTYTLKHQGIINDLSAKINSLADTLFYKSAIYQGHRYYLMKDLDHFIYSEVEALCEVFGGYLLELDDHEEFLFVKSYLQQVSGFKFVMTGATDLVQEGLWVNKHRPSLRPVFDWGSGEPRGGRTNNCQAFSNSTGLLVDHLCSFRPQINEESFCCEIPD